MTQDTQVTNTEAAENAPFGFKQAPASGKLLVVAIPIFIIFAFLFLYGNGAHSLWDRDEPRYADAAQTMYKTGQIIVPMFNGDIRYDKPVLVYWLMNIPMHIWGISEFSCRAMQALGGAAVVACVWLFSIMLGLGAPAALIATLICGLSPLLLMVSKASTTDSILLLTIITALMVHWNQRQLGFAWWRHILFWLILGISALQKGHPGLIVVGLTYWTDLLWGAYQTRRDTPVSPNDSTEKQPFDWRTPAFRTGVGLLILLTTAMPWVIAAWVKTDGGFFLTQFDKHVLGHAVRTLDSHWGPAIFYIPILALGTLVALPITMTAVPGLFRQANNPNARFLLSWLVPGFFVFTFAGTKLPHYIIPVLPALAILLGYSTTCWARILTWRPIPRTTGAWALLIITVITLVLAVILRKTGPPATVLGTISLASIIGCWLLTPHNALWRIGSYTIGIIGTVLGISTPIAMTYLGAGHILYGITGGFLIAAISVMTAILWDKKLVKFAIAGGVAIKLILWVMLFVVILPAIEPLRPSKPIGHWIDQNTPANTKLFMAGYKEPSLVFYSGRVLRETGTGNTERELVFNALNDTTTSAGLVITKELWDRWTSEAPAPGPAKIGFSGKFFQFQKGGQIELLAITN